MTMKVSTNNYYQRNNGTLSKLRALSLTGLAGTKYEYNAHAN